MKPLITISVILLGLLYTSDKSRIIKYNGSDVKTTYEVADHFYGLYDGPKSGFLKLETDGTGQYNYDVFGFAAQGCKKGIIEIEWGFLLNDDGDVVSFEREYGKSYPILMRSTGETKFEGCRKQVILDFIMMYKDGRLGVSSSDNWVKKG